MYNPMMQNQYAYEQSLKNIIDQANGQLNQLHTQPPPTNLTQNFQLTPAYNNFRIVGSKEEVEKEMVLNNTFFLAKDNKNLWIKNTRGDIRTFTLEEVTPKDDKDLLIENLQRQINELKGSLNNGNTTNDGTNDATAAIEPAAKE
jgi:hypothetical protein